MIAGNWDDVVKIYQYRKDIIQKAEINRAMHVAISDGKTEVVDELLKNIDDDAIREMTNEAGENLLHLAASLGLTKMCNLLLSKDPKLIETRNTDGETPLFLAAMHGEKDTFYSLHPKCPITGLDTKYITRHCRKNDGNTILHVSIQGEHLGNHQLIFV